MRPKTGCTICGKSGAVIWTVSSFIAAGVGLFGDFVTGLITALAILASGILTTLGCCVHSASNNARRVETLNDRQVLHLISNNEVCMLYQPICDISTGKIVAVEAFTRLCSKDNISDHSLYADPQVLSDISLDTRQLLLSTIFDLIAQDVKELEGLEIHVNISARDLTEQSSILILTNFSKRTGVPTSRIVIDLHTLELASNLTSMTRVAAGLSSLGFNLSLDSYSQATKSLSEFTGFPLRSVKLGRDVLDRVKENRSVIGMTKMIIRAARRDGLLVTAKQVETEEEKMLVADLNFDLLQGQIISPPITAANVAKLREG